MKFLVDGEYNFEGAEIELVIQISTKYYKTKPEKKFNGGSYHSTPAPISKR